MNIHARTVNNEFVNVVNKSVRYNMIASAARKNQYTHNVAVVIECSDVEDFADVVQCAQYTSEEN